MKKQALIGLAVLVAVFPGAWSASNEQSEASLILTAVAEATREAVPEATGEDKGIEDISGWPGRPELGIAEAPIEEETEDSGAVTPRQSEGPMSQIQAALTWTFTYVLYPAAVIGFFLFIFIGLWKVVSAGKDTLSKVRRFTGAALPLLLLVFAFALLQTLESPLIPPLAGSSELVRFLAGGGIALIFMEWGMYLLNTDNDGAAALYALFLSTLGTFLIWIIIEGYSDMYIATLLGFVLAGGLHIIFRGLPRKVTPKVKTTKRQN